MREVRWERMFPDELEEAFAGCPLLYFPYGLCEPHGPQNAVGLDAIKAHTIATRTAQEHGGIVAPPDYWHVHEIGGYAVWAHKHVGEVARKWTTSVPPWHHFKSVLYHVRTADTLGFKAAIFLTGHYGPNWEDLKTILEIAQPYTRTRLYGLPDWEANTPGFDGDGKSGGDHAGKVETSLLAALDPECVDLTRLPPRAGKLGHPVDTPPHFAMGSTAAQSDRLVGERMVRDEVAWLGRKAAELLSAYDAGASAPGFPTFASVEELWQREIVPKIPELASMQPDFGLGSELPENSVWKQNADIPPGSTK